MSTGIFTPKPVYHPDDSTKVVWSGRGRKSAEYKKLVAEGKIVEATKASTATATKAE
jgi:DNA-binding protein H-NS